MSNYTIAVSWSGKDALSDSDTAKIISGDDFNTEFTTVQTAVNSKADLNGSASEAWSCSTLTVTTISLGGTSITSSATELNLLDGLTAVRDEDTMSSDSATSLATQQSIKAYVDTEVAGVVTSTWSYISRHTLFTGSSGNHNTWTSASIPTAQVPSASKAIILSFESIQDEGYTTTTFRASGIAERIINHAYSRNNSDDEASSYNTITIPYKTSIDIKWYSNSIGNATCKVYIDGYVS